MASVIRRMDWRIAFSPYGALRAASWPLAVLVLISHVAWGDPGWPSEALFCGGLLAVFALVSCAYARPGVLPVIPMHLTRMYFAMGFPVFSPPRVFSALGPVRVSSNAMVNASIGGVLFCSCLIATTLAMLPAYRRLGRSINFALDRRGEYNGYDTIAVRCLAAVSIALYLTMLIYSQGRQLLGPFTYLAVALATPELSLGLLFWDAHQTQSFSSRIISWAAVIVMSVGGFAAGMLGYALAPWLIGAVFLWTAHRRFPVSLVAGAIVLMTLLNPAKFVYRQLSWGKGSEITLMERAENWVTAISETYFGDAKPVYGDAATGVASRASSLLQVVHIFEWVPARIRHAGPEAWLKLPLYFVPRMFWPDKPVVTAEFNRNYAVTFRLNTERMTKNVTLNLPSVGDGYWRLAWFGIVLEGALAGLLTAFSRGLGVSGSRTGTILGMVVMGLGPEGHALGNLIALPKVLLATLAVLLLAQWLPHLFAGARKTTIEPRSRGAASQAS